jgi:hypothetical protein
MAPATPQAPSAFLSAGTDGDGCDQTVPLLAVDVVSVRAYSPF